MIGFTYELPDVVKGKRVSAVEVGPFDESAKAEEINRFFGTGIKGMTRTESYLLVRSEDLEGIEKLLRGKPFVDRIMNRAALNSPLIAGYDIPFDFIFQNMRRPGTSDPEGDTALRQTLLSLKKEFMEGDVGFHTMQHFIKAEKLTPKQLEEIAASAFLANPDLNTITIIDRKQHKDGHRLIVPVVPLKPEVHVEKFDVVNMPEEEFRELNSDLMLAATLEEWGQFRSMYRDENFLKARRDAGLDERATDVELVVWYGLRSEHCFHKEFNAHITLEDRVDDPIFKAAFEKGWLTKDEEGNYVLERGLFKTFVEEPAKEIHEKLEKRGKNWIASMFEDNSGVVLYNEDYMFCIKFETHNSPSNKEPIQGSKTGIDGVNRDIIGTMLGTFEMIANFFLYCTGNPNYKGWLPKGVRPPYVLLKGMTQGTREGGNEMQIPTFNGGVITDPRYIAKCLDYCGTVGWSPVRSVDGRSFTETSATVGDIVFVAGQPVGIDGIGGATQSSLSASGEIRLGHVQADFSFIQAKMKDLVVDIGRKHYLSDITDCGAMGICAALELARAAGGVDLDFGLHPKKYAGIRQRDIGRSETQNRMVLSSRPDKEEKIQERAELHDVQVTKLGELTDSGYVHLKYDGKTIALIDIEKLFDKEPRKKMHATWNVNQDNKMPEIKGKYSLEESLCLVMEQPDVASKEWFFRQKDSSVKGATIQGPLIGLKQEVEADATIQKPLDTEGKDFGAIAYAMGIAPKISDLDPYHSAQKSFMDMVGKIVAIGGTLPDMENPKWDAWAVCGNYCQPNSEGKTTLTKESGEHNLASLIREGIGIRDAIEATNIPIISGKDSMKCSCVYEVEDDFKLEDVPLDLRRHIIITEKEVVEKDEKTGEEKPVMKKFIEIHDPDTFLASAAVKIDDYRKCVSSDFKQAGDLVYVLGTTRNQLGASQYLSAIGYKEDGAPIEGGECPETDLNEFVRCANAIHEAIDNEVVASCRYVHNGGIAAALAKSAMAGEKGAEITTACYNAGCNTDEAFLYSENAGRWIMTVAPEDQEKFEGILGFLPCTRIGKVTEGNSITVKKMDKSTEEISLDKVKKSYQTPLGFELNDLRGAA